LWWLVAAGLAVLGLVFWQAVVAWWETRGWPEGGYPLLMVLIHDQAEVVEGLLRAVLRLLAWSASGQNWDVVVLDTGSCDETPVIARRLLSDTGVPFVQTGGEWCRIVEEAAHRGRPVLLVPLRESKTLCRLPDGVGRFLGGKSRIFFPAGELQDKCNARS